MCIFGGSRSPAPPPPLPPAPPPPLPPAPATPPPDPVMKDVNPAVKKAKKDKGSKAQSQYAQGTGALKIKLNPKINTGTGTTGKTGGLN